MVKEEEDFKKILKKLKFIDDCSEDDDNFILFSKRLGKKWQISKESIELLLKKLQNKKIKEETILYDEYSYEVLVKFETLRPIFLRSYERQDFVKVDKVNNIKYELSKPTDEYLLFILDTLKESEFLIDIFRVHSRFYFMDDYKELKFFEFLNKISHIYTLKITSQEPISSTKFSKLSTSFIFNLSYNLDVAIIEINFLHELIRHRIAKVRRSSFDEIEPPRRLYNPDLVYYYQMAISTDGLPLQFLSFYHVIEYFFHNIYYEDLINTIKNKLTDPGFSYKKKRDIESLIKLISQKIKSKDDEILYNEREALYLTLVKYVKLENLVKKLMEYEKNSKLLIDYYKRNKVSFSKGDTIDFSLSDSRKVFDQIANRIYKTRNSIVHSKEGGKPKYIPFRHDKELVVEIPLIRFIAEELIINTSEVIS